MCSKFYSLVLSCTARAATQPRKRPNGGFLLLLVSVCDAGHLLHTGRVWARYVSESDWIHFFGFDPREWISSDSLWRSTGIFCTILYLEFCHMITSFLNLFSLFHVTLSNTLSGKKKEPGEPYRFGKALRALSIFSLFYLVEWAHFPRKSWWEFNKNQIIRIVASITRLYK